MKELHIICNAHCGIRTKMSLAKSDFTGSDFTWGQGESHLKKGRDPSKAS